MVDHCGFSLKNFDTCSKRVRLKYPGGDPENGPARPYCSEGHSTCYNCGKWFPAITPIPAWTDEETGQKFPESSSESDWCQECEVESRKVNCGCGQEGTHTHSGWACCGSEICCELNE